MLSRVTALSFRAVSSVTKQFCTKTVLVDGYQSQYAIAKLYPSSNHDFNRPFKSIEVNPSTPANYQADYDSKSLIFFELTTRVLPAALHVCHVH